MKNLPFLQELTEARLFQRPEDLRKMSAEKIGETIFLMIMTLEMMRYSDPRWAAGYAADTMRYNPYDNMHFSGTDLANLFAVLNFQETFKDHIKVNKNISVPLFQINRYLGDVRSGSSSRSKNEDAQFFWRLEDYLKAYNNSTMRTLRRNIGDWESLSFSDKKRTEAYIRSEMGKIASGADIFLQFRSSFKLKESVNEYAIKSKLAYNKVLNPRLWDENAELHEDVKDALGRIANKFSEFVDVKQLKIVDYIITGSNCAFNYTEDSDVDLHILVDASQLGDNPLTEPFLMAKKSLWNSGHDITVKGYTVELYAEDVNNEDNKLVATGIYSLLHDKWIKQPEYEPPNIDDNAVQQKAEGIIQQIDMLMKNNAGKTDSEEISNLWDHIRKMRRAGLSKGGEFSIENLAFKVVRNSGYFDKLREYERSKEDEDLTLETVFDAVA